MNALEKNNITRNYLTKELENKRYWRVEKLEMDEHIRRERCQT